MEFVIEKVKKHMNGDSSGHGFDHVQRVYNIARYLLNKEDADEQVVLLAALLHDADDYKLFGWICKLMCPELMKKPFDEVIWYHSENGLPSYETVTRARQALQHDKPELRGKKYQERLAKQSDYIDEFGRKYS